MSTNNIDPISYWTNKKQDAVFHCPNVDLFRLMGKAIGDLRKKNILEIGFGHGADLVECERRGANVVGLDLNLVFVENLKKKANIDCRVFRAGVDKIPFSEKFDLIFSRDTIYYLTDDELVSFIRDCSQCIEQNGKIILQFIEMDLKSNLSVTPSMQNFDINFLACFCKAQSHNNSNPIRYLQNDYVRHVGSSLGLKIAGSKIMLESLDVEQKLLRVNRYIVFEK